MTTHHPPNNQLNDHLTIPTPSYPTRCLEFLHNLPGYQRSERPLAAQNNTNTKPHNSSNANKPHSAQHPEAQTETGSKPQNQPSIKLKILIAGAGLGGLGTAIALARQGHTVTIFEQTEKLGEVGAGIQIPSNSARLLLRWGIAPHLSPHAVEPSSISFRRWQDGSIIGHTSLIPNFRRKFGAPYYVVHRAHFHDAMLKLAVSLGVEIRVGAKVVGYDLEGPAVELADGSVVEGDLVVGSDGIKSLARAKVLGREDGPMVKTGFAAYRATVDVGRMREVEEVAWLVDGEKQGLNIWIGHKRHVMTYTIAAGNSFNMVLSHPDTSDPSTWDQSTALEDMRKHFEGWDPVLTRIINMVDKTMKWPLLTGPKLNGWVAPSGKVLILGDAAHAMLPYMSQGAAMAIEDGATLATALSHLRSKYNLPQILSVFERLRATRCAQMQDASALNGVLWHFEDGEVQRARDWGMGGLVEGVRGKAMKDGVEVDGEGEEVEWSANQWSDPVTQEWCYGHDAEEEVERTFAEMEPRGQD